MKGILKEFERNLEKMIREICEKDIAECVSVIKESFVQDREYYHAHFWNDNEEQGYG